MFWNWGWGRETVSASTLTEGQSANWGMALRIKIFAGHNLCEVKKVLARVLDSEATSGIIHGDGPLYWDEKKDHNTQLYFHDSG